MSGRRSRIALLLMVGLFVQSRHAARRREAELAELRAAGAPAAGARGPADAAAARGRAGRARPRRRRLTRPTGPSMRLRKQQRSGPGHPGGAAGRRRRRALVLAALQDKVAFFVTPTAGRRAAAGARAALPPGRAGRRRQHPARGRRRPCGSRSPTRRARCQVAYKGLLPDLFRDGQGVVTQGVLRPDGVFEASEVLAKHDENYMPKEVADALKQAGYWNEQQGKRGRRHDRRARPLRAGAGAWAWPWSRARCRSSAPPAATPRSPASPSPPPARSSCS